jgi:hypothetical protein
VVVEAMTGKYDPKRYCCVCGTLLPDVGRKELIARGAATIQGSGQVIWHCPTHSAADVQRAIRATPTFSTGLKYRKNPI